jgi:hypothetical protein
LLSLERNVPASSIPTRVAGFQPKRPSALAPQVKRLLSQFTSDLGDAVKDTADQAGRLQDLDAMSEYRSAARLGQWTEAAWGAGKEILKKAPGIGQPMRSPANICRDAKRKGNRNEHRSIMLLEGAGYACTSAAASLGYPMSSASAPPMSFWCSRRPATGQAQSKWRLSATFSVRRACFMPVYSGAP